MEQGGFKRRVPWRREPRSTNAHLDVAAVRVGRHVGIVLRAESQARRPQVGDHLLCLWTPSSQSMTWILLDVDGCTVAPPPVCTGPVGRK